MAVGKLDDGHRGEIVDSLDPPVDTGIYPYAVVETELVADAAKGFAAYREWIVVWPLDVGTEVRGERRGDDDGGFPAFLRSMRDEGPSHIHRETVVCWARLGDSPAFTPDVFDNELAGRGAAFRLWAWHDAVGE